MTKENQKKFYNLVYDLKIAYKEQLKKLTIEFDSGKEDVYRWIVYTRQCIKIINEYLEENK